MFTRILRAPTCFSTTSPLFCRTTQEFTARGLKILQPQKIFLLSLSFTHEIARTQSLPASDSLVPDLRHYFLKRHSQLLGQNNTMKLALFAATALYSANFAAAFAPANRPAVVRSNVVSVAAEQFDQEQFIAESKEMRLKHLEEQAMYALKISCENYENAVFPNAMIAGDVVITHLLHRMGYLKDSDKCKIMCVDTFHLFPETMEFLKEIEDFYGFKAEVFCAEGIPVGDKDAYDKRYGADLWKENIEEYDRVCKVEPFQRGLKTLNTNCMINGRTRWQGFERAWIDLFENAPIGGGLAKCNPLAYWTLEDCFDYIAKYEVPHHPLHAKGYPSIGDAKDTIPIPEDGSVYFKDFKFTGDKTEWLDYATERKGRFVGLANADGSTKTECGKYCCACCCACCYACSCL